MTVLIDVNLSPDWIDFLVVSGITAIHWSTVGDSDAPDFEIMAYAIRFNCVVLTQDLDYGTILAATKAVRPSVVLIRAGRVHPASLGAQVVAAILELAKEPEREAIVTIEPKRTRLTVLPFDKLS